MSGLEPSEREGVRQKIVDRLLLLYLYDRVSEESRITGDVKLQKLAFLSEKSMIERDAKGLTYKFFRWDHGPMSKEVYEDREFLEENDLVSDYTGEIKSEGQEVLEQARDVFEANREFIQDIDDVVEKYGEFSGSSLKQLVYNIEVTPLSTGRTLKVEDIPETTDIFFPIPDELAAEQFEISDGWISTLDILMSEDSRESLERSIRLAKQYPGTEFEFRYLDPEEFESESVTVDDVLQS